MAIEDGFIQSVDDPLSRYLPELACGPYEGVSIAHALQMLSGVEFMPGKFDWRDMTVPAARVYQDSLVAQRYRYIEGANSLVRKVPAGTKFAYSDMDAALVGGVLENATARRLATYTEQRLWKPAGMEFDAVWVLDGPPSVGREVAALSFAATLRDYGRFGLLALYRGQARGRQLVSAGWFDGATRPQDPAVSFGKLGENYPLGYGRYWWLLPDGSFTGQGAFGHFVYVSPHSNVVIVKHSHWPKEWDDDLEMETYAFFESVTKYLASR
jgi:CubicO group peptidase (beta-lactamase class C family)